MMKSIKTQEKKVYENKLNGNYNLITKLYGTYQGL